MYCEDQLLVHCKESCPSDHICFHVRPDPLLSERDRNFAYAMLNLCEPISGDIGGKRAKDIVLISRGLFMIKGLKLNEGERARWALQECYHYHEEVLPLFLTTLKIQMNQNSIIVCKFSL